MDNPKDIFDQKNDNINVDAQTRRIPKSLIEEQIKIERERELKIKEELNKTTVIKIENLNIQDEQPEEINLANKSIDSTQVISIDKTMTIKLEQLNKLNLQKKEIPFNSDIGFQKPKKQINLTPWILMIIIIIIAAIVFYIIGPKKDGKETYNKNDIQTASENITKEDIAEENIIVDDSNYTDGEYIVDEKAKIKEIKPALLNKVNIIETVNITNENLSGESQKIIRKKGALLSEEDDPKVVAIVDGLFKRFKITSDAKTSNRRGVLSKRWKGIYRGFKIDAQKKEKGGKVIFNRIFLTTPSKGQISIISGVLNSTKKITYETFIEELGKNGISIIENDQTDEKSISVNLSVLPPENALSKDEFLLSASGIFGIKGGDGVENIKLNLPEGFRVIKKNISIDEKTNYNIHKVHNKQFHPLFFVKEWGDRIEKVEIISTRFRTKEKIGINSKFGLMRIYFPNLKIARTKNNLIIIIREELSGYFIIDATVEDFINLNIKDSAKIIKIVLE